VADRRDRKRKNEEFVREVFRRRAESYGSAPYYGPVIQQEEAAPAKQVQPEEESPQAAPNAAAAPAEEHSSSEPESAPAPEPESEPAPEPVFVVKTSAVRRIKSKK
jgi:hypothetical protein